MWAPFSILPLTIHLPLTFKNLFWVDDLDFSYCYFPINLFNSSLIECKVKLGESQLLDHCQALTTGHA